MGLFDATESVDAPPDFGGFAPHLQDVIRQIVGHLGSQGMTPPPTQAEHMMSHISDTATPPSDARRLGLALPGGYPVGINGPMVPSGRPPLDSADPNPASVLFGQAVAGGAGQATLGSGNMVGQGIGQGAQRPDLATMSPNVQNAIKAALSHLGMGGGGGMPTDPGMSAGPQSASPGQNTSPGMTLPNPSLLGGSQAPAGNIISQVPKPTFPSTPVVDGQPTLKPTTGSTSLDSLRSLQADITKQYQEKSNALGLQSDELKNDFEDVYSHIDPKTGKRVPYQLPKDIGVEKMIGGKAHTFGDIGMLLLGLIAAASGRNGQEFAGGLLQGFLGKKEELAKNATALQRQQFDLDMQARQAKAEAKLKKYGFDSQAVERLGTLLDKIGSQISSAEFKQLQEQDKKDKDATTEQDKTINTMLKAADSGNTTLLTTTLENYNKRFPNHPIDPFKVREMIQGGKANQAQIEKFRKAIKDPNATPVEKAPFLAAMKQQFPDLVTPELEASAAELPPNVKAKIQRYDFLAKFNPERIKNLQQSTLARIAATSLSNERKKLIALEVANFDPLLQAKLANIYNQMDNREPIGEKMLKDAAGIVNQRIKQLQLKAAGGTLTPDEQEELDAQMKRQGELAGEIGKVAKQSSSNPRANTPVDGMRKKGPDGAMYERRGGKWYPVQ